MGCNASKELRAENENHKSLLSQQTGLVNELNKKANEFDTRLVEEMRIKQDLTAQLEEKEVIHKQELQEFENNQRQDEGHIKELEHELERLSRDKERMTKQLEKEGKYNSQMKRKQADIHKMMDAVETEAKRMEAEFIIPCQTQLLMELWEERMTLKGTFSARKPPRFLGEQWFPCLTKIAKQSEVEMFLSPHPLLCSRPHDQKPTMDSRMEINNVFVNTRIMFDSEFLEDKENREGKIFFSARSAMKTVFSEEEHIPEERDLPQNIVLKVWERRCSPEVTLEKAKWNLVYQSHPSPCNIEYTDEHRKSIRRSVADTRNCRTRR